MSATRAAVLGFGQTKFRTTRADVGATELVFEAVSSALVDADIEIGDIDAVVFASAPEVFEGVYEPDRWCVDAFGGAGKPLVRIHTGGATGGSGALTATRLVEAGMYETVLVVGLQRTSETADAQKLFTTMFDPAYEQDVQLNVITGIALVASRRGSQSRTSATRCAIRSPISTRRSRRLTSSARGSSHGRCDSCTRARARTGRRLSWWRRPGPLAAAPALRM
jgi:acetyl-CoA acetyltransferase